MGIFRFLIDKFYIMPAPVSDNLQHVGGVKIITKGNAPEKRILNEKK